MISVLSNTVRDFKSNWNRLISGFRHHENVICDLLGFYTG
jgi:predicted secreted Zn-dependent protease